MSADANSPNFSRAIFLSTTFSFPQ